MQRTVEIGYMPGTLTNVAIDDTTTVQEVIDMASLDASGYDIKVDGATIEPNSLIPSNARVIALAKKVKGNADFILEVGFMPGTLTRVQFEVPTTVEDILAAADITSVDGYEAKLDGVPVDMDEMVYSGRVLVLAKKVKGNL